MTLYKRSMFLATILGFLQESAVLLEMVSLIEEEQLSVLDILLILYMSHLGHHIQSTKRLRLSSLTHSIHHPHIKSLHAVFHLQMDTQTWEELHRSNPPSA